MLKERNDSARKGTKKDKVVRRELCSVLTRGTRTHSHLDEGPSQEEVPAPSSVLLCLVEESPQGTNQGSSDSHAEFGVCMVDTVLSSVTIAHFEDNSQLSRLGTLMTQFCPTEVLLPQDVYSQMTRSALSIMAPQASIEHLSKEEMTAPEHVLRDIEKAQYWAQTPVALQAILVERDSHSTRLVLRALGGMLFHLKRCRIDHEIMSAGKMTRYVPFDNNVLSNSTDISSSRSEHLILDDVALVNLEILSNSFDKAERGSLWSLINRCKTPFGSRMLREWLCKPLVSLSDISARSDAIAELLRLGCEVDQARIVLKRIPDVERLLSRVHCNGLLHRATSHPDSRAIMFEPSLYNSRKIRDFTDVLSGFEAFLELIKVFDDIELKSDILNQILKSAPFGNFPSNEMSKSLSYFRYLFYPEINQI